jgi:Ca-activated chloride channel family protein
MNFQYPLLLLAVIPLILLSLLFIRRSRSTLERKRFPLFVASLCFVLIALAKPYWATVPAKETVKGVDLILITDVSQSMFCNVRGKITRLDLARKFVTGLLPSFAGSQVSLIYFAGDAQIGSPFTTDLHAIQLMMDSIAPAMSAQPGTRTDSLEEALDELFENRIADRLPLILFFSDGEFFDTSGNFQRYLERKNFRIFTYLCGNQKTPVPNYDLRAPVPDAFSTPNDPIMRQIAQAGKGKFFDLTNESTNTIFEQVSDQIDEIIVEGQSVPDYRPVPFLIIAVVFLLGYQLIPTGRTNLTPEIVLGLLFLSVSLSMKPEVSRYEYEKAITDFQQGNQEKALERLKNLPADFFPAEKNILTGNVYYSLGKYEEAIQQYEKVLESYPHNEIARWNWEVALKRRSDSANQPPDPEQTPKPENRPEDRNALLKYVDQLEKEQRQKSNRVNMAKSEFAW